MHAVDEVLGGVDVQRWRVLRRHNYFPVRTYHKTKETLVGLGNRVVEMGVSNVDRGGEHVLLQRRNH